MLAFLLTGGYFVRQIPVWIRWLKYISFPYYTFRVSAACELLCSSSLECKTSPGFATLVFASMENAARATCPTQKARACSAAVLLPSRSVRDHFAVGCALFPVRNERRRPLKPCSNAQVLPHYPRVTSLPHAGGWPDLKSHADLGSFVVPQLLLKIQYSPQSAYECPGASPSGTCLIQNAPALHGVPLGGGGIEAMALIIMLIGYRFLAYAALRVLNKGTK